MKFNKLILNTEKHKHLHPIFEQLITVLPRLKPLASLIKDATKGGKITVDFVPKEDLNTRGSWDGYSRTIKLDKNLEIVDLLEVWVFELCNANNQNFQKNGLKMDDYPNREKYTRAKERAEYEQTYLPCRKIIDALILNDYMLEILASIGLEIPAEDIEEYKEEFCATFKQWWKNTNINIEGKTYSHADIYRGEFDTWVEKEEKLNLIQQECEKMTQQIIKQGREQQRNYQQFLEQQKRLKRRLTALVSGPTLRRRM